MEPREGNLIATMFIWKDTSWILRYVRRSPQYPFVCNGEIPLTGRGPNHPIRAQTHVWKDEPVQVQTAARASQA